MPYADCHPVSAPVRTTEPTNLQEPVTLQEARRQCGLGEDNSAHDELLQRLITAARQQVEQDAGLICYTGSFTLKRTEWPEEEWFDIPELRPVTSITSITYLDGNGDSQTLATTVYAFESSGVKQFVRLKYGQTWPTIRGDINGITITAVAGYSSVANIPARIKQACLLLINHWFENHGIVGPAGPEIAFSYQSLVNSVGRKTYP